MTPHELPAGFPGEAAVEAAELALAKARNGGDTIADQQRAEYRAVLAADWPLLREAAIKEAVAATPDVSLLIEAHGFLALEYTPVIETLGHRWDTGDLVSRLVGALSRALLAAGKTP